LLDASVSTEEVGMKRALPVAFVLILAAAPVASQESVSSRDALLMEAVPRRE